ncbi:unnamed protein product [Cochlearia groenlandica]
MAIITLSSYQAYAGRVVLKNEFTGLHVRRSKLAIRCWSNEDDLGWTVLKPGESRRWTFTTMNMWPFKKTEFKCKFQSGLGTTKEELVTVFSVKDGFSNKCNELGNGSNECVWVAKREGFYQRKIVKDVAYVKHFDDVLISKWVWKW